MLENLCHFILQIKTKILKTMMQLILFRMDLFGTTHGRVWEGGGKKLHLSKICHTYPTMMQLGTVIPYPKKLQKINKSRDTLFELC